MKAFLSIVLFVAASIQFTEAQTIQTIVVPQNHGAEYQQNIPVLAGETFEVLSWRATSAQIPKTGVLIIKFLLIRPIRLCGGCLLARRRKISSKHNPTQLPGVATLERVSIDNDISPRQSKSPGDRHSSSSVHG